jgi:hypothetical protein
MQVRGLIGASGRRSALALAASVVSLCSTGAQASAAGPTHAQRSARSSAPSASAVLEECLTSPLQAERSATFAGEMTAVAGTVRMAMRIDVDERMPEETTYHTVSAPGLGVWRLSDPRVKIYKYLKQVTNLSSPAVYRAVVRFRWLAPHGHVIKRAQRFTGSCVQPAMPSTSPPQAAPSSGATAVPAGGSTVAAAS